MRNGKWGGSAPYSQAFPPGRLVFVPHFCAVPTWLRGGWKMELVGHACILVAARVCIFCWVLLMSCRLIKRQRGPPPRGLRVWTRDQGVLRVLQVPLKLEWGFSQCFCAHSSRNLRKESRMLQPSAPGPTDFFLHTHINSQIEATGLACQAQTLVNIQHQSYAFYNSYHQPGAQKLYAALARRAVMLLHHPPSNF